MVKVHDMKTYKKSKGTAQFVPILGIRQRWLAKFTPGCFTSAKEQRYQLTGVGWSGTSAALGGCEEEKIA